MKEYSVLKSNWDSLLVQEVKGYPVSKRIPHSVFIEIHLFILNISTGCFLELINAMYKFICLNTVERTAADVTACN